MRASLFDSNVWVALTFPSHTFHHAAVEELETHIHASPACFCRATQQSFLRLITTRTLAVAYGFPELGNEQAVKILRDYHELAYVDFLSEPSGTYDLWLRLADRPTASPKLWMDAYLAAFAISGNHRFVTTDTDFRQFQPHGLDLHLLGK